MSRIFYYSKFILPVERQFQTSLRQRKVNEIKKAEEILKKESNLKNNFRIFQLHKVTLMYMGIFFMFVWPRIITNFFIIKPTRCTNLTNLFWHEILHVSDRMVLLESCPQTCITYIIAECTVNKPPDDGQTNCPKHVEFMPKQICEISESSWFYYKGIWGYCKFSWQYNYFMLCWIMYNNV